MDTVTQITLGAAVGEAWLGKKLGNKAPAWGAVLGVVPDLDVLAGPFVSEMQALVIHRGITHSLFFCVVAPPLFGWLLHRFHKNSGASWRDWSLLAFLAFITHIFIDACTSYGTQVLQPFSNYSLSFNTIFIIDPFYTLPLLLGVITALFLNRNSANRRWANYIGLGLSSAYMLAGFFIKAHVNTVFEQNFNRQEISVDRYMTTPMPFTEFLWVSYAISGDHIYAGLYSVFDDNRDVEFQRIDRNAALITEYENQLAIRRIRWFSQGYFAVSRDENDLVMHDLRFGRSDLWLSQNAAPFVWNYRLLFNEDSTRVTGFEQQEPAFNFNSTLLGKLTDRIAGEN